MKTRNKIVSSLFPKNAIDLLATKGAGLIKQIGEDVIRGVIYDVMCGRNLRDSTEMLTRQRLALLNAATLVMYMRGQQKDPTFLTNLAHTATKELQNHTSKEQRWVLQWMLGLTDKGFQNILRDSTDAIEAYKEKYVEVCREVVSSCAEVYGDLHGTIRLNATEKAEVNWNFVVALLNAIGAQTLAIRGSEKATYGKLFERLILGSLLSVLGFQHTPKGTLGKTNRVFWLASRGERRESDATLLYEAGKGVRFDIGFIGRGNPEISLDKVSRFEREIDLGRERWYMATIIIVDRIGERSSIERLAKRIDGKIIQMSLSYWPQDVAMHLRKVLGLEHPLISMKRSAIADYLKRRLTSVRLEEFIVG